MKGIIYKIYKNDMIYIGSTERFNQRMYKHKYACNTEGYNKYNFKLYKTIRENGGWDEWNKEILYEFDCKDRFELRNKENEFIKIYKEKCINQLMAVKENNKKNNIEIIYIKMNDN